MVTLKGPQIALKYCLTTPMKFASLLINMNFIGQAETPRTQRKTYLLPPIGFRLVEPTGQREGRAYSSERRCRLGKNAIFLRQKILAGYWSLTSISFYKFV